MATQTQKYYHDNTRKLIAAVWLPEVSEQPRKEIIQQILAAVGYLLYLYSFHSVEKDAAVSKERNENSCKGQQLTASFCQTSRWTLKIASMRSTSGKLSKHGMQPPYETSLLIFYFLLKHNYLQWSQNLELSTTKIFK